MVSKITPGTPHSRTLALAVLVFAIFLLWEGLVQPVLDLISGNSSLVSAQRSLDELERVTERLPALTQEKAKTPTANSGFLPGTDPHLAAAALAGRLNMQIKALNGDLASSEAIDLPDEDGIKRVGLRLRATLPEADLPGLLYGLEFSDPTLFVQSLAITAGKDERLTVALDLYGYLGGPDTQAARAEIPTESYPDIVTRPLFNPSRHGSAARAATVAASSLRLVGLVAEKGRTIALVSLDGGKNEVRIGAGASLNGWRVAGIDGKGLDLAKDGRQTRVTLKQPIPSAD